MALGALALAGLACGAATQGEAAHRPKEPHASSGRAAGDSSSPQSRAEADAVTGSTGTDAAQTGVRAWRAAPEPLAEALAAVGLRIDQLRIDPLDAGYFGGGQFRQQIWETFLSDPMKIEPDLLALRRSLVDGALRPSASILFASGRLREGVRRGLIASPILEARRQAVEQRALATAIGAVCAVGGKPLGSEARRSLESSAARVPDSLAHPAALLLRAVAGAIAQRERALHALTGAERADLFRALVESTQSAEGITDAPLARRMIEAAGRIESPALYVGGADLALALDDALDGWDDPDTGTRLVLGLRALNGPARTGVGAVRFRAATPFGDVVISGDGPDLHDAPALLIIDAGGDDRYRGAGTTLDARHPVSIAIDLSGNDTWNATAHGAIQDKGGAAAAQSPGTGSAPHVVAASPTSGCGVLGYGYLVDLEGNDVYEGASPGQGAGLFGVGLLYDGAGDDRYSGSVLAQGAAAFGVGALVDLDGTDQYAAEQESQGFGFTRGFGILFDRAGDDQYAADDTNIRFPSPQSPEHNTSLSQGCGAGRRADFSDGLSLAGGIGLLVDAAGNDVYRAGVFAQGAAYWYGVGLLDDAGGDDAYEGAWYVQGSAAHFGVGALRDESGNDHFQASLNMAQGAGHDFSWGSLIDCAGNDIYEAPNLSLGGGNDDGIGFFWDRGGDDLYRAAGETTLGRATIQMPHGGLRDRMLCAGIFLDTGGGTDTYRTPFAADGTLWTQPGSDRAHPLESEKGVGIDR